MRTCASIALLISFAIAAHSFEIEYTVLIVDAEDGSPLEGVTVNAQLQNAVEPGFGAGTGKPINIKGRTDEQGVFVVRGRAGEPFVGISAWKAGYYMSSDSERAVSVDSNTGRWVFKEDTMTLSLRPVRDPVSMQELRIRIELPDYGSPYGYDLRINDLVEPHGSGEVADLQMQMNTIGDLVLVDGHAEYFHKELIITCDPGFIIDTTIYGGSILYWPYEFPAEQPQSSVSRTARRDAQTHGNTFLEPARGRRILFQAASGDRQVSGVIPRGISILDSARPELEFRCWLNPDGSGLEPERLAAERPIDYE